MAGAVRGELELRDPDEARAAADVPAVDLGLGDDIRARVTRGAGAYRSRDRALALVLGSAAEARGALGRAMLRGAVGLAIVAAVAAGHRWGSGVGALVAYDEERCDHVLSSCYDAGLVLTGADADLRWPLTRAEPPPLGDLEHAERLFLRACNGGEMRGCRALVASLEARGGGAAELPYWYPKR